MSVETFSWIVSAAALVGVWMNVKRIKWCFAIWAFTNLSWFLIDLTKGIMAQAVLMYVYMLLSVWGLFEWTAENKKAPVVTNGRKERADG